MNVASFVKNLLKRRIVRYVISGGTSFVTENVVFLVTYYTLSSSVKIANLISILFALTVNFLLTKFFVFQHKDSLKSSFPHLIRYGILASCNIFLSTLGLTLLIHHNVPGYIAKPSMTIMVASWTYVIYRKFIFKNAITKDSPLTEADIE